MCGAARLNFMNGYRMAVTANCPKALRFGFVEIATLEILVP